MLDYFSKAKPGIAAAIETSLNLYAKEYEDVSADLGQDAAKRLKEFALRGKMLRGCLVRLGFELVNGRAVSNTDEQAICRSGAALELFQSGLLIHDDIMDRDRVRRGQETVHVGYERSLAEGSYDDPEHYGEALGICAGDLAYFAAFSLLSSFPPSSGTAQCACSLAARELALVGIAQMQDVVNGAVRAQTKNSFRPAVSADPSEEGILKLYRYKTGRYTFSLPLSLGASLAGADPLVKTILEQAGEVLGLLFQLKDDELGLFGNEAELGKNIGSDIRENKKTLFRLKLLAEVSNEQKKKLESIFGNHRASEKDVSYVIDLLEKMGIRDTVQILMKDYAKQALDGMDALLAVASPETAQAFHELVSYSLERES
ncbi:geranylgeranyl pyrophosphate synthase IdsA [Treponema sp.]